MGIVERRVDVDVEQTRGQLEALKEKCAFVYECVCMRLCLYDKAQNSHTAARPTGERKHGEAQESDANLPRIA